MRNDPIGKLLPCLAVRIKEARQPVNDALGGRRIIIYQPSLTLRASVPLARSVSEGWYHLPLALFKSHREFLNRLCTRVQEGLATDRPGGVRSCRRTIVGG